MLQYWKCRKNTIQSALDLQKSSKKETKNTLARRTQHIFSFSFLFLRQHEFAGSYDWHRATIKRPMESSQRQSGKYSTRRVMLGTCWDIDFVPGWSYRTDRVSAFWHGEELPFGFVQQFRWQLYYGCSDTVFLFVCFFYQYDHDT